MLLDLACANRADSRPEPNDPAQLGLGERLRFAGDNYVVFVLASVVYLYGGWPFLSGLTSEFKRKQPGMMTLVAMAISTAYVYSTLVVFGLSGEGFFWELATLVDIMLLG